MPSSMERLIAVDPTLLPLTKSSLLYLVRLPDSTGVTVVISPRTTVSEVVFLLASQFSDRPLIGECQLLRNGFPLSKSLRLCSLPLGGQLAFSMAYEDPRQLTENVVAAVVEHAVVTRSGSPRHNPRRGEGNIYLGTSGARLKSVAVAQGTSTAGSSQSNFLSASVGNRVQYGSRGGFREVPSQLTASVVESQKVPITVRLVSAGARELRRLHVNPMDPVASLRDELFPNPESSLAFRLFCDSFPVLNESASFVDLLISEENILEFRVDIASGSEDFNTPDAYGGGVWINENTGSKEVANRRSKSRPVSAGRMSRGESTPMRAFAGEPSLAAMGTLLRGDPLDTEEAVENTLKAEARDLYSRSDRHAVGYSAPTSRDSNFLNTTRMDNIRGLEIDRAASFRSPEPRGGMRVDSAASVERSQFITSPPLTRARSPPSTRSRAAPSTRTRSSPRSSLNAGSIVAPPHFSTSTVGEAASEGPVAKQYDPTRQVPIVFVDPDDPQHLHRINVHGAHLVTSLREFGGSSSHHIVCDGSVLVPAGALLGPTFWDATGGIPGRVFSLEPN